MPHAPASGVFRVACAAAVSAFLVAGIAAAQESEPDLAIVARVRADQLRFERVPEPRVRLVANAGSLTGVTVWTTDRHNLPDPVQPNVTYRDIGILLTITSTLPDIEEILDDALGAASRVVPPHVPDNK